MPKAKEPAPATFDRKAIPQRSIGQIKDMVISACNVTVMELVHSLQNGPLDEEQISALDKVGRLLQTFENAKIKPTQGLDKSPEEMISDILDTIDPEVLEAKLKARKRDAGA